MKSVREMRRRVELEAADRLLQLIGSSGSRGIMAAAQLVEKLAPGHLRHHAHWLVEQLRDETPLLQLARRVVRDVAPACREKLVADLVGNGFLDARHRRAAFAEAHGVPPPVVLLVSPTMRCNLACEGCYAAEYPRGAELTPELLQAIIDQANEMGIHWFTVLGGEPFVYDGLLDLCEQNTQSYFQVFTNGTLLDEATVDRLARMGNVAPMLSIEGDRAATDARRGEGVYDRLLQAMDRLRSAGVMFGTSSTVTRRNWQYLISDDFAGMLVAKGAFVAWFFLYMPLGRTPDLDLMPTPEQRARFREGVLRIRAERPLIALDFWGDAPLVGGCIAARRYLHITSEGWVEPCIFTHFATHNIRECTLEEAFTSPYFSEIRRRQPYNDNLLMPCMWIDNPKVSREIMAVTGACPTHAGADVMITELHEELERYAADVARLYEPAWEELASRRHSTASKSPSSSSRKREPAQATRG